MVSSTGLNHLISFYKKVQVHFGQNNMSGNVSEYCYGKIDYTKEPKYTGELEINPVRIDETGNDRPSYGGSWNSGAGSAIVHSFPANPGSYSTYDKGFRVVRSVD